MEKRKITKKKVKGKRRFLKTHSAVLLLNAKNNFSSMSDKLKKIRFEDTCHIEAQLANISFSEMSHVNPYELKCMRDWTNEDVLGTMLFFFIFFFCYFLNKKQLSRMGVKRIAIFK